MKVIYDCDVRSPMQARREVYNAMRAIERTYHNEEHIKTMLAMYQKYFNGRLDVIEELKLNHAIIYHDVVYDFDAKSGENEIASALYYRREGYIIENFTPKFINDVANMIIATAHHFDDTDYSNNRTVEILLDLDLFTFSYDYDKFKEVNDNILSELMQVRTREEALIGRLGFLQHLKARDIFRTPELSGFNSKARSNILNLIIDTKKELNDPY